MVNGVLLYCDMTLRCTLSLRQPCHNRRFQLLLLLLLFYSLIFIVCEASNDSFSAHKLHGICRLNIRTSGQLKPSSHSTMLEIHTRFIGDIFDDFALRYIEIEKI